MTTEISKDLPTPPEAQFISPEALDQLRRASARDRRRKLLVAALITAVGIGASVMSCVGQSFGYRQARALEGIQQQLQEMRASCPVRQP
jgi:hypothetical protein